MQLRILDDIVHTIATIHRLCRVISRHDPGLGKQMKRPGELPAQGDSSPADTR